MQPRSRDHTTAPANSIPASGPRFTGIGKATPVFIQIAEQLIRAITIGELPIDSRLPSEIVLAEQFGVSRASVREALSSLQFSGYVESRRGAGTVVCATVPRGAEVLGEGGLKEPGDLVDLLEARLAVEAEAAAATAADPIPEALREVHDLLEGMELTVGRTEIEVRTDLALHLAIARTCRNRFLAQASEHLITRSEGPLWRQIRNQTWAEGQLPRTWVGQHEAIVNAITDGDSVAAAQAVRTHLLSVLTNVMSFDVLTPAALSKARQIRTRYELPDLQPPDARSTS
jgi:GntR family transcriptional regulator, transcriptional repressor for pyruvate dehydrogenase complex